MNCIDFEAQIDDYLSDRLSETDRHRMQRHHAQCHGCADAFNHHLTYLDLLSMWQEPRLDDSAKKSLFNILEQSDNESALGETKQRGLGLNLAHIFGNSFIQGFALASFLALGLFISSRSVYEQNEFDLQALLETEAHLDQEITLVISVDSDIPDAELHLELPAELSVVGHDYLAQVSVPLDLKKGTNTIVIPVRLEEFAFYSEEVVVDASLTYKNGQKDFALELNKYLDSNTPQKTSDELILNELETLKNKTV